MIQLVRTGALLHVRLDRPDARNSIDIDTARQLLAVAQACASAEGAEVVLIDASGTLFCPGGDLRSLGSDPALLPARMLEVTSYLHAALTLLHNLDLPIVVAVRGAAAGAGLGLACLGDIVVASESARFVFAYSAVGLSPDAGVSYQLPRLVGLRRALDIALTNRPLSAAEALEAGLVTAVVPDSCLEETARRYVELLLSQSPAALRATKRAVHRGASASFEQHLAYEATTLSKVAGTPEAAARVSAFLSK